MLLHPLQCSLDKLIGYLRDGQLIFDYTEEQAQKLAEKRRARGSGNGGGRPPAVHYSLHRAVVVAALGAWEEFCEDLALTAVKQLDPKAVPPRDWYKISGKNGMVQTPNADNVRKLFWTLFHYDPVQDWDINVTVSPYEIGVSSVRWRREERRYQGAAAADFLDTMMAKRDALAHQDKAVAPAARPGITEKTGAGKITIQSHHAENSLSVVVQLAILTTRGLADTLELTRPLRWSRHMTEAGWSRLLDGTTAGNFVAAEWVGAP